MLRLGYKASAEQFAPRTLLDFAVEAERNGFDSVFVSDHFQPWRHSDGHAPFAFAWLAATGERTQRVLLGTSVATPTFRYHPAIVAQAFGTLGLFNPGRMILGVGTGEHLNEGALGIAWPDNKERFARLREAVKLIKLLWTEQSVTFDGEYYHTRNATIYDRPAEPIPIYVGAGGPLVAKYAGRAGDGLICTSGKGMELYSEQLLPAFAEGAAAEGRDASSRSRSRTTRTVSGRWRIPRSGPRSPCPRRPRRGSTIRARWRGSRARSKALLIGAGWCRAIPRSTWSS
jgi:coenzyme F420-dependent glucose-6-phosphate dehydrogenase